MIAIILLILISANALVAGYLFMADPSGRSLGIPASMLRFSAFENFFLPGLVLFTVNGVLGLITAIALIRRSPYYSLHVIVQGLLLTGWIVIQVLVIREFNFLHAALGGAGLFLIAAGIRLLKQRQ